MLWKVIAEKRYEALIDAATEIDACEKIREQISGRKSHMGIIVNETRTSIVSAKRVNVETL